MVFRDMWMWCCTEPGATGRAQSGADLGATCLKLRLYYCMYVLCRLGCQSQSQSPLPFGLRLGLGWLRLHRDWLAGFGRGQLGQRLVLFLAARGAVIAQVRTMPTQMP